jgi:hypothetical protein
MKSAKPSISLAASGEEIQVSVRLRGDDLTAFNRVKQALERPNNLNLDNAEVLRSTLRDKAKTLDPKVDIKARSQEQLAAACEQVECELGNDVPVSIIPPASLAPKDISPEGYGGFEIVLEKDTIHDIDLVDITGRLETPLKEAALKDLIEP